MKSLTTFILCLIFQTSFFAQDLIVKSNGEKVACKIVDVYSSLVSFRSEDTTKKEISILQKQDVLALKLNNEKTVFFFVADTLVKSNGNKITCKVIGIDPRTITYIPVDSNMGDLMIVPSNKFSMIRFGNGSQEAIEEKSDYTDSQFKSNMDYYKLGQEDAKKYYKTGGVFAAEVISGLGTYILGVGFVTGAIVFAIPPQELTNAKNPNNALLKSNPDYYNGFKDGAKCIKHQKAAQGYAVGILAPIAVAIGVIAVLSD